MSTRGILRPRIGERRFTLERLEPCPDLAELVERHWIVRWDLRDAEPFVQETLPHPAVNMVVGTHRPGVHGVPTRRFEARLDGVGWVVGVKFKPGGFFPVEHAQRDPAIARAADLARAVGLGTRSLERLFRRYVGVAPKWVVRRFRIHEACERASSGQAPRWSELAQELGYCDQAHFARDFKVQVGVPPAEYAAACCAGAS